MKQAHISRSLSGLPFRNVYNLSKYTDSEKPLIIFGMYRQRDLDILLNHNSDITLVWQGCDGRDLTDEWAELIKSKNVKHYAISHWISDSLTAKGIEHELVPISATKPKLSIKPNGDAIYIYSSDLSPESGDYHGDYFIDEIKQRTGLEVIRATINTYSKKDLFRIYEKCFINLRLTKYDGCPNTNLEMGLMGRKSIFNGGIPHSIKWDNIDDICESIMKEYETRHEDNSQVAYDIQKYIQHDRM